MNTAIPIEDFCLNVMRRSSCAVQVGAAIEDDDGIFGWGWNHMGNDGFGEHAEVNAIKRSNRNRLANAVLYVASQRARNQKAITSKPCPKCQGWIESSGIKYVWWRGGDGLWRPL